MPSELALMLDAWIEPLRAQEALYQMKILDYPTMTKEARSKLHKTLYRDAFPKILMGEPKALTLEDLARMGNG